MAIRLAITLASTIGGLTMWTRPPDTRLERRLRRKVLADHLPVVVAITAWLAFACWTLYGWAVTLFEHAVNGVAALRGVLARVDAAQGWRPVSQLPRV